MEIGDKVYCKKERDVIDITLGRSYILSIVNTNYISINNNKGLLFSFGTIKYYGYGNYFNDYFYTEKEMRKLKLEAIENR